MSGFYWLDEPFEGDRVPTAADLERATPLPVTSWSWWEPKAGDEEHEHTTAELERLTRPTPARQWGKSPAPAAPGIREALTTAMQSLDLQLTPWQQRIAELALDGRLPVITYPRQFGRRSISRVVDEAMNGAPVPLTRELHVTITADTSRATAAFAAAVASADRATHALRIYGATWLGAKARRRRSIEQRRIRQAMRHIDRRAARRQRRAASLAARGGAR